MTLAAGLVPAAGVAAPAPSPLVKPPRLREGDWIGLVSPSGVVSDEGLQKRVANLARHRDALLGAVDLLFYGV